MTNREADLKLSRYSYPTAWKIPGYIVTAFCMYLLIFTVYILFRLPVDQEIESPLVFLLFIIILLIYSSNLLPDVEISQSGLAIKMFFSYWKFIPWEEVAAIRPSILSYAFPTYAVHVYSSRLSFFHYIFGILNFRFGKSFIVLCEIQNYNSLVHRIREQLESQALEP